MSDEMDPTEFRRILHNGLGRAILYLRDHDAAPHREAILYACLHDTVFDRQAEGSNAEYIFEAVLLTAEPKYYRDALLLALRDPQEEYHLGQICDLLRGFAQQGDQMARSALYDAFDQEAPVYGAMFAIVELDGISGFLHIAEGVGASAEEDEDFWEGGYFLDQLIDDLGEDYVRQATTTGSAKSPRIAAYLAAIEREQAKDRSRQKPHLNPNETSYDQLKELLSTQTSLSPFWMRRWGQHASDGDLLCLADDLMVETRPYGLRLILRAFTRRAFPNDYAVLVALVDHSDEQVAIAAVNALAAVIHPDLREYALALLPTERAWVGLQVLQNHYLTDDHFLVETLLRRGIEQRLEDNHRVELDAIALFERYPTVEATPSLILIYEHTRCTYCRKDCVFLLHQLGTLPEAIRRECEYDAYSRLRIAARRHFREEDEGTDSSLRSE